MRIHGQWPDPYHAFGNVQQTDGSSSATATWVPSLDIHEYENCFELYVDIPVWILTPSN